MAAYLENLYSALRTVIAAEWTDVPDNGIWEAEHAEQIPWEDLTPPYAVIAMAEMPEEDVGLANLAYAIPCEIYYVSEVKGHSSSIRAKLETLRSYLWNPANTLSTGQVWDIPELTWSRTLEPNVIFQQKRMKHRAGRVRVVCLVGETAA